MNTNITKRTQTGQASPPIIPSFSYQLNHYNTLQNIYHDSRFSDGSQQETIQERVALGGAIIKQERIAINFRSGPVFGQNLQKRHQQGQDGHEVKIAQIDYHSQQKKAEKSIKSQHISNNSLPPNQGPYPLLPNKSAIGLKKQSFDGIYECPQPILFQKSGLQSLKSQNYSNNRIMKQESGWSAHKIQQRPQNLERANENSSYSANNSFKRIKAKRQEISTRFQNYENTEESQRMQEELFLSLNQLEFQELFSNEDFEEYCLAKVGRSFNPSNLKKEETRSNGFTPPSVKREYIPPAPALPIKEEPHVKLEAPHTIAVLQPQRPPPMLAEIGQWPIRYDEFPLEPRYELKLENLPDDNYDFEEIIEDDNFFNCMF